MSFELIMVIVVSVIFVGGLILGYYSDKKRWNNGICANTGAPWIYFDTDSQGGRGYKSGDYTTWISYPGVDRDYNHTRMQLGGHC